MLIKVCLAAALQTERRADEHLPVYLIHLTLWDPVLAVTPPATKTLKYELMACARSPPSATCGIGDWSSFEYVLVV